MSQTSLWEYANPRKFLQTTDRVLPWVAALAGVTLVVGLVWGFFFTPDDYRQGATVKIVYLHVPAALMAINAWLMMLVASLIWIIRRHHVSALAARAAAPVGMIMTVIALLTGAIWGQPIWGTWWVWDPRLTSFLILFLFYLGYMALWEAIENDDTAADLTATPVPCRIGLRPAQPLCRQLLESGPASGGVAVGAAGRADGDDLQAAALCQHDGIRVAFHSFGAGAYADGNPRAADAGAVGARTDGRGVMPDLGKYTETVLSSYAISLILLAGIILVSLRRARRVKKELQDVEKKVKSNG